MDRVLMTHSLLGSWLYALRENPYEDMTTERDPMEEFKTTLARKPTPVTPKMQMGIDFEDLVTAILQGKKEAAYCTETRDHQIDRKILPVQDNPWYEAAAEIANQIQGGILQYRANKSVSVAGLDLVLHGRLDALKAGHIYDIKFTRYERGKYFDSTQHPMYFELVPEAVDFTYLASNGSDVWTETYRREDTRSIYPVIGDFVSWLSSTGLLDLYKEKWGAK